jgi:hypothetical protein
MKYDDMNYNNGAWKSDKKQINEAYEDLFKVYAEKNRRDRQNQVDKENQAKWKKKEEEQKARDMADVQELPAGYGNHKVKHHSDMQEEDSGDKKELLNGEDELEESGDHSNTDAAVKDGETYHDGKGKHPRGTVTDKHGKVVRSPKKKSDDGDEKKDKWVKAIAAAGSNYDEYGLGTFEESKREMSINELWALCGTGEEIWNESGEPTNEMKTKVGDTVFFTWNYQPDDPNSCRTLCSAKIVD